MAWNKDKIKAQIIELEKRIATAKTEKELLSLKFDCECLCDVYNMLDRKYPLSCKKVDLKNYAYSYRLDSMECAIENKNEIARAVRKVEHNPFFHPKCARVKKISEEEYLNLVGNFLKHYDTELYITYQNMLTNNIEFQKLKNVHANGMCYQIHNLDEFYIINKNNINKTFDTLPHEMGHVKDFSIIQDFKQNINFRFSCFTEAYPKFLALLFDEYLQETEYKQVCLEQKRSFFDNLRVTSEIYTSTLSNIKSFNMVTDKLHSKGIIENSIHKGIVDSMASDIMAIYMLNLYKKDRIKFNELIVKYYQYAGISEEELWKLFDFSELSNSIKEEVFAYNNEVYKSRKRVKSFNLF